MARFFQTPSLRFVIAIAFASGCGTRADGSLDPGPSGGGSDGGPLDASSGTDASGAGGTMDGAAGSGGAAGASGGAGGVAGSGGAGGSAGAAGSTGGATAGAGGTTDGAAGTSGSGGTGGVVDAGDPSDISTPQDAGAPQDVLLDMSNPDGCMPIACSTPLRTYCGWIGDGCGGAMDCGSCTGGQVCGPRRPNFCGAPCPLCPQVQKCESGVTTVRGKAVTGAATNPDPLYAATVFIPNVAAGGKLPPIADGPSCNRCKAPTEDEAIAFTSTAPDGTFTLTNVPAGAGIPLVVQLGDWRYETTIDVVPCVTNNLAPGTARLPRMQSEGNIPLTAVSTGNVDALECILRKIGVADTEFSNPTGSGRIHFYRSNGATYDAATPAQTVLTDTAATWDRYDQILFPCEGAQTAESPAALTNFINYTSKGGRVITTHYSYTWLYQNGGFATVGAWQVAQPNPPNRARLCDVARRRRCSLQCESAASLDFRSASRSELGDGGARWSALDLRRHTAERAAHDRRHAGRRTLRPTLRARIYSDFHVANGMNMALTFPAECMTPDLTAQEKILEFMLLDLATCGVVDPPPPPPDPPPLPPGG